MAAALISGSLIQPECAFRFNRDHQGGAVAFHANRAGRRHTIILTARFWFHRSLSFHHRAAMPICSMSGEKE
jgi:hypothetical protein